MFRFNKPSSGAHYLCFAKVTVTIFIVAPCIPKIHQLLKPPNALLCIVFILKHTLKHLKSSYMFRSIDHHQGAHVVPC
jgi:hypothetical protein